MNQILWILIVILYGSTSIHGKKYRVFGDDDSSSNGSISNHRLLIDVDIYNRPYVLPYFLGQLEKFTCPCSQCHLDFRLYHVFGTPVEKETSDLVTQWVTAMKSSSQTIFTSLTIHHWKAKSKEDRADRLKYVMQRSSELKAQYLAMFDSMIILLEPEKLLSTLISKDKPLMTPLLRSTKNMFTSTFFLNDQESSGYHAYRQIYERKKIGCFLIDGGIKDFYFFNFQYSQIENIYLKHFNSDKTTQITSKNKNFFINNLLELIGSTRISLAIDILARQNSVPMYVCNRENFGYIPAQFLEALYDETLISEYYFHMLIEHQLNGPEQTYLSAIPRTTLIDYPKSNVKTKFGLDEIYVINLARRQDRRDHLQSTFDILNISARFFEAVDGKYSINQTYLERYDIRLMPNYEDPYNRRPMNFGELGCFFSHYFIWEDMVKNNYVNGAMILEDDVRFDVYFKYKLEKILANRSFEWDLIYLGRKIMRPDEEDSEKTIETYLIEPSYSHWTIGYLISLRAAKILLEEKPLQKLLPVDEYLPIMYGRHPNKSWIENFINRTLKAYAFHPVILTPSHYFGEPNYTSDTENTTVLEEKKNFNPKLVSVDVVPPVSDLEKNPTIDKDEL